MNTRLSTPLRAGLVVAGCLVLVGGGFAAGAMSQRFGSFAPFWQAWDIVHQEYVSQPVDDTKLMQGAIGGMLQSLNDPYTTYMDPTVYQVSTTTLSGQLEGIGAEVEGSDNYLRIVSPYPGSPAEKAGLQPGDLIVKVDGQDMGGLGTYAIIMHVRGPAGSTVHLTILRGSSQTPMEFDVVRAKISVPSVESKMLDGNVAYIKLNDFGENTPTELQAALTTLLAQKPAGLVLDLRGNPGGYVTTAIAVASQFIDRPIAGAPLYALIITASSAMGIQSVAARLVVRFGISTVVFTSTLTSIATTATESLLRPPHALPHATKRQIAMFLTYGVGAGVYGALHSYPEWIAALPLACVIGAAGCYWLDARPK